MQMEVPAQGAPVPYDPKLPPDGQWNTTLRLDPGADWPVGGPHVPPSYWPPHGQIPFTFFHGPMGQPRAFTGPHHPFHPTPPHMPPSHILPPSSLCAPQPFPTFFSGGNRPPLLPIPNSGTYSSLSPIQYSYVPSINPMPAENHPPLQRDSSCSPSQSSSKSRSRGNKKTSRKLPRISSGPRSKLLHDFRTKMDTEAWQLGDVKDHVVEFCKDQYGSRFVQDAFETATNAERDMVFGEIVSEDIVVMSKEVFGNYVVQRVLEYGTDAQRNFIHRELLDQIRDLALHIYGCRVVQKLLDVLPSEHQVEIVRELEPYVSVCVQDAHGNHVIQKVLEVVPSRHLDFVNAFRGRVVEFARHTYGCRVVQRCLQHVPPSQSQPLLDEFMAHAFDMITDEFGNYVVQYILEYGPEEEKGIVLSLLQGHILQFARHKHASNVCEMAIVHSPPHIRHQLIDEILVMAHGFPIGVWQMIHDPYGNYVLQRAMVQAVGYQHHFLMSIVAQQIPVAWGSDANPQERKYFTAIDRILKKQSLLPHHQAHVH